MGKKKKNEMRIIKKTLYLISWYKKYCILSIPDIECFSKYITSNVISQIISNSLIHASFILGIILIDNLQKYNR